MTNDDFYTLANQYQQGGGPPPMPQPSAADEWRDAMAGTMAPGSDMRVAGPGGLPSDALSDAVQADREAREASAANAPISTQSNPSGMVYKPKMVPWSDALSALTAGGEGAGRRLSAMQSPENPALEEAHQLDALADASGLKRVDRRYLKDYPEVRARAEAALAEKNKGNDAGLRNFRESQNGPWQGPEMSAEQLAAHKASQELGLTSEEIANVGGGPAAPEPGRATDNRAAGGISGGGMSRSGGGGLNAGQQAGKAMVLGAEGDAIALNEKHVQELKDMRLARAMHDTVNRESMEADQHIQEAKDKERADYAKEQEAKSNALMEEVRAGKIDPNRATENMSAPRKALFVIAAALSGFANRGGKNVALDAIDSEINRDIDAQKEALNSKRSGAALQNTLVGQMYQRFGNMEHAEAAARAAKYEKYNMDAQAFAAQRGDAASIHDADMLGAQLKEKAGNTLLAFNKPAVGADPSKRIAEDTTKFIEKGMDPVEARRAAIYANTGQQVGAGALKSPGKEGDKTKEETAQMDSDLSELRNYKQKVHLISPSLVQGFDPVERGKRKAEQERYAGSVARWVGKMYQLDTNSKEPKNVALIEKYAEPYLPSGSWEPEAVTLHKMNTLEHDLQAAGVGKTGRQPLATTKVQERKNFKEGL